MTELRDLGFQEGVIMETIVSTYNERKRPNAAPMGILMKNKEHIILRPFTSALTFKNLCLMKCGVVNLTFDIELFFRTTFKAMNCGDIVPYEWFEKSLNVNAPKLKRAQATIDFSVVDIKKISEDRVEIMGKVNNINAINSVPQGYSRAFFATLEAIIYATRVQNFLSSNIQKKKCADTLIEHIKYSKEIVKRVAPKSIYSEIINEIEKMIGKWKQNEGIS